MELIRKTRTEINKNGNKIRYAIFKCPFCLQEVERCISNGLKQKSCGCIKLEKMEHHRYGKHNTNEARQKMSLSQKKRFLNLENHPMYGKKHSKKSKNKNSESHKGKKHTEEAKEKIAEAQKGIKNNNWNNGSSFEPYSPEFNKELKQSIKDRDFHICQTQNCMNTENSHIHHIDYDKKNNKPENLVTLCGSCHSKTSNHNRLYWTNYYSEIVSVYL